MTMDDHPLHNANAEVGPGSPAPVTEADLHAYADHQHAPERAAVVERYLAHHPEAQARVRDWQQQNRLLHRLLDPVLDEPLPLGLPLQAKARSTIAWSALAAGVLVAVISGGSAWFLRGHVDAQNLQLALAEHARSAPAAIEDSSPLTGFAQRAAIAHVVYSPDVRRPVEVGADQEQALVTWLTKRMGTAVNPPTLAQLGYALIGGRLLPGDKGPVAQFMYESADGQRLTLYVTREVPSDLETSFKFGKDDQVNVFYWIEDQFGYAISAGSDKAELMRVAQAVYMQLKQR